MIVRKRPYDTYLLALLMFCGFWSGLAAQAAPSWTGQWQGSIEGKTPSRVLLRIEPAVGGAVQGVVYLLDGDNPDWPHATSALAVQSRDLSFRIVNMDVSFAGKLNPVEPMNGTLNGIWTQHGTATPLKLTRVSGDAAWAIPASTGKSMAGDADPAFEVVTIKPADPKDTGGGFQTRGQRLHVRNESLENIVCFAYSIHREQIQNAPGWFTAERWEIDGIPDTPGTPNLQQQRSIYRKLLADRFALKLHQETRELPVYLLEIASGGAKLTRSLGDPKGPPDSTGNWNSGMNDVRYTDMTMDEFAEDLAFSEDRPVVNGTELAGRYDFRLRWASADAAAASQSVGTDAPPVLFTAVREQLGLSLKANHAPATVYVVAHAERPSAN